VFLIELAAVVLAAAALGWSFAFCSGFSAGGDGVIGRLTLADGSEFRLIQQFNRTGFHYTVDFYVRLPNQPWGWCYIAHKDTRWRNGRLQYNPEKHSVDVYRGRELRAQYFTEEKTFALYAEWQRKLPAPQAVRDPPM
jgi:hypothetical protein